MIKRMILFCVCVFTLRWKVLEKYYFFMKVIHREKWKTVGLKG